MSKKAQFILVTVIFAVASFALSPVIWPRSEEMTLFPGQLPLFIVLSVLESIAFGTGIAFLIYGWSWVRCVAKGSTAMAWGLYIPIAWYLISWWPHDNMHATTAHDDLWRLLLIEYLFHVTLVLSAFVLAWCFFHVIKGCQRKLM